MVRISFFYPTAIGADIPFQPVRIGTARAEFERGRGLRLQFHASEIARPLKRRAAFRDQQFVKGRRLKAAAEVGKYGFVRVYGIVQAELGVNAEVILLAAAVARVKPALPVLPHKRVVGEARSGPRAEIVLDIARGMAELGRRDQRQPVREADAVLHKQGHIAGRKVIIGKLGHPRAVTIVKIFALKLIEMQHQAELKLMGRVKKGALPGPAQFRAPFMAPVNAHPDTHREGEVIIHILVKQAEGQAALCAEQPGVFIRQPEDAGIAPGFVAHDIGAGKDQPPAALGLRRNSALLSGPGMLKSLRI